MEELKKLKVTSDHKRRPLLKGLSFGISSLEEVLEISMEVKENESHPLPNSGLLIELK